MQETLGNVTGCAGVSMGEGRHRGPVYYVDKIWPLTTGVGNDALPEKEGFQGSVGLLRSHPVLASDNPVASGGWHVTTPPTAGVGSRGKKARARPILFHPGHVWVRVKVYVLVSRLLVRCESKRSCSIAL